MRIFEFAIIDKEVSKVTTSQLEIHKRSRIKQTVFNGNYFFISYEDWKTKEIVMTLLDKEGKIAKQKRVPNEKNKEPIQNVYPAEGDGFYLVRFKKEKGGKRGYTLTRINNSLENDWEKTEIPEKGVKQIADMVNSKGKLILWEENSPKGKVFKPVITCLDPKTGKKVYSRDGYDGEATIQFNNIRVLEDGSVVLGGSYVLGQKTKGVNVSGIYILKINAEGKDVLYSKVDMKTKIQPVLKEASKGLAIGSKAKVFVEDIIIEGDNYYVVSEMFRKNINMKPLDVQRTRDRISGKYIGDIDRDDPGTIFTFEIMDFMLFNFNSKGDVEDIKAITKSKYNKITLYPPYNNINWGGMKLAKLLSQLGWFDYGFTGYTADGSKRVMVCKDNAHPRRPEVYFYDLNSNYAKSKLHLTKEANIDIEAGGKVSYFNTLPAKKGKVTVIYFQRKAKKITLNSEDIK